MTIGSLFRGTWAFIRANPRVIAAWGLANLLLTILMHWGMGPFYEVQAANIAAQAQGLPPSLPPIGRFLLTMLIMAIGLVALYNAAFRAVLRPEERRFAYLRLGMDELRLIGLIVVLWLAMTIIVLLLIIVMILCGLLFRGMVPQLGNALPFLITLLLIVPMLFVSVRLVLAAPLTLYRRKIMIGPAWRLTRGQFWRLFGAAVLMAMLLLIVTIPFLVPTMGPMLNSMGHPGDATARQQLAVLQAQQIGLSWSPIVIVQIILSGVLGGVYLALFGGMPAIATLQLLDEKAGIAA